METETFTQKWAYQIVWCDIKDAFPRSRKYWSISHKSWISGVCQDIAAIRDILSDSDSRWHSHEYFNLNSINIRMKSLSSKQTDFKRQQLTFRSIQMCARISKTIDETVQDISTFENVHIHSSPCDGLFALCSIRFISDDTVTVASIHL